MLPEEYPTKAVFVDQSGRRRRLMTMVSIGSGIPLVALVVILVGGLFSDTGLSGFGWPGDSRGGPADKATPDPAREARPSRPERPTPTARLGNRPAVSTARPVSPSARPRPRSSPRPKLSPRPSRDPAPHRRPEPPSGSPSAAAPDLTTAPTPGGTTNPSPDGPTAQPTTGVTTEPTGGSATDPATRLTNGSRPLGPGTTTPDHDQAAR
ncbi:hypothetical protein [Herbidospora sp. NBRC 101105]|uniref:hypothetical protein n=1 Tax=Herbidospora sp. NBRC 101105 TaxID=3032195 RepID=UPI0025548F95|nr:hypothetical protein [Herbidospora sp. NBRC 101105]